MRIRPWPVLGTLCAVAVLIVGRYAWERFEHQRDFEEHLRGGHARVPRMLRQVGALPRELTESSGIAVSRTQAGVLWSHNDSGGGPVLYALDLSGRLLARFTVARARNHDWEAMSAGPCPGRSAVDGEVDRAASCLYLADIGDNEAVRRDLTVYIVEEPEVGKAGEVISSRAFRFRYPDGADDSEAFAVGPDGDVIVVTKGRRGTIGFFRIAADAVAAALESGTLLTAEAAGRVNLRRGPVPRMVTGAAMSPDGRALAVRTYHEVFFYDPLPGGSERMRWQQAGLPCLLGDAEPQGEAIDYLDRETLILTSEGRLGRGGALHQLRC